MRTSASLAPSLPAPSPTGAGPGEVTTLLQSWADGDRSALDRLIPAVYGQLRRVARSAARGEQPGHTLQATGLVHEAFIRLSQQRSSRWSNRYEFYGWASRVMRQVLVDHARARQARKRGGGAPHASLDDEELSLQQVLAAPESRWMELLALDEALNRLKALDPQQARVVELRFFGELGVEETAQCLGISTATVKREWATARAWLLRELKAR
ncbi:sigma-70 family RNA polymerase sigma factor [Ideonella sp. YS5]|uniref:sigma-70 family RNA polymerase sigma factor n=1 Tax=Ideonella sp. YS5 TaxID=3453714 RepID=UPI003EE8E942